MPFVLNLDRFFNLNMKKNDFILISHILVSWAKINTCLVHDLRENLKRALAKPS